MFPQDYNDHIAEISAKLVAIMDSLFEKVLSKVRAHTWHLKINPKRWSRIQSSPN